MSSLLAKRIFSSSFFTSYSHHQYGYGYHLLPLPLPLPALLSPLQRLSLSTQQKEIPFMAQYLISSFGFPSDRALKVAASDKLIRIKTPERPNSVVSFLKDVGLSDAQIKKTALLSPQLLVYSTERTLRPRYNELIAAGFTHEILSALIQRDPKALCYKDILSHLQFWKNFVDNSDDLLLKVVRRSNWLMGCDIGRKVVPRLNLLKEFGLSNRDIVNLLSKGASCMSRSVESLRQILEQTEELGFKPGSAMFRLGLTVISHFSKETLERKVEFLTKTYSWSGDEVSSAFRKFPCMLAYSVEKKLKPTMDFLIRTAKLEPRSIASQPTLLSYSLNGRLLPRHQVLSMLQSKGLKISSSLANACYISEERFIKMYVVPYEEDVPGIREAYVAAAHGGKKPH